MKDIAKIKTTIKNPFLVKLLKKKNKDTSEVWRSIRDRDGSVQHLDFLSLEEKKYLKLTQKLIKWILYIKLQIDKIILTKDNP